MNLGEKFKIKTKVGENHTISLSKLETIYRDENEKFGRPVKLGTNIAKMNETYVNGRGDIVSEDHYVYFEIPYEEGTGGLPLIPKLIEAYEKNRNHMPRNYEYNYIGNIYYDKTKNALIYSKVCANKEVRGLIAELNKRLRRFRIKGHQGSAKPTFFEKMADEFNTEDRRPEQDIGYNNEPKSQEEDDNKEL